MRRSAFLSWPVVRLALAAPVAAGLALAAAAAVAPVPAAQAATTTTFTYTGSEQTYPVPAGVTAVTITTVGAPGGTDDHGDTAGGNGASVTATVPLPANTTTLYVEVGGPGAPTVDDSPAVGGFNGGGGSGILSGGSGGGASDVRTTSCGSPCNTNDPASLASRLVVAGGGGGAGANFGCGGPGGTAGDTSVTGAGNGGDGSACGVVAGGNGGFGGTAGGTGGATGAPFICPGDNGSLGQGGDAPTSCDPNNFGGGGGGGYYGGGGGGDGPAGGGGGAGSSFWVAGATGTSMSEDTTGTPEVEITPVMVSVANPGNQTSTVGTAVSLQIQATDSASGQSLTYSATGLPAGLSISSSGLISGTPTTAGSSSVTVTATDTTGTNGSASFTWTVTSALLTVTTTSLPGATLGSAYSAALAAAGGIPPYSWSVTAGSLPPGLSLSSSGTISGTPAEAGTYSVTIQAADSSSPRQTATAQLSITVGGCTTSITGSHSGQIVVGKGQFVCIGPGASQNGAITVTSGGGLSIVGSTLTGGVSTSGAVSLGLSGSTINGSVSLTGNHGPSVVSGNAIVGSLSCSGNNPPPVDNGRANKVSGKSSGQCSALG